MPNLDSLFSLAGGLVLTGWLLLIVAPRWRWTQRLTTFVAPLLIGSLYATLMLHAGHVSGGGFRSLDQVARLFSSRQVLLAGWIHYLAFDLFVGAWQTRDALRVGLSRWIVAPCLVLTFLFGPAGLALYLLLRLALRKEIDPQ